MPDANRTITAFTTFSIECTHPECKMGMGVSREYIREHPEARREGYYTCGSTKVHESGHPMRLLQHN